MDRQTLLYKGKAKSVYSTEDENKVIMVFRDDTSAFNGERLEQLARKGKVNNLFNAFIMKKLAEAGVPTHFEKVLNDNESLVKNMQMLPIECVVRNYAAGSLCRRLGLEEGSKLSPSTFELFYKDDALGDPMVNDSIVVTLGWSTQAQLDVMKELTYKVNDILFKLFDAGDLMLVDFKLEFGLYNGQIMLGDEFSPDGCRLWDKETKKKLDKDRFRQGLGNVIEGYEEVAKRIGASLD